MFRQQTASRSTLKPISENSCQVPEKREIFVPWHERCGGTDYDMANATPDSRLETSEIYSLNFPRQVFETIGTRRSLSWAFALLFLALQQLR